MADRIPTLGDICSAIAEGHLDAALDGASYQINAFELRRFLNRFRSLPTISSLSDDAPQTAPAIDWSVPTGSSVA